MPAKKIDNYLLRPLAIVDIIALIITGWAIYDHNKTTVLKTSLYTSSTYDFTIAYPGTPKTVHTTKTVDNISAQTTYVSSSVDNGAEHFEIYASNLPQITQYNALPAKQKTAALNTGIDSAITVLLSATDIKNTPISFLNTQGVEADFKTSVKNRNINGFGRSFVIGHSEYLLISTGASKANFLDFANSFKYTGK